jgi:hypothetical protein
MQQNYPHLQQGKHEHSFNCNQHLCFFSSSIVLFPPPIPTIQHLSYDEATRPRTIVYDNGTLQAWSSNEPPHYLAYPSNELAHQTDQVHVWQDSTTGGTYIQYLGTIFSDKIKQIFSP